MFLIYGLIIINSLVFALPYLSSLTYESIMRAGWKENAAIADGEYYRLFTSTFLHGDLMHLFFNMYALYNIGPSILAIFGTLGFALIYFLSGIGGSLLSYFMNPIPSVGASGAIFGLVGAVLAFSIKTGQTGLLQNMIFIVAINFGIAFFSGGRIDNWGHAGGLIVGFILGYGLLLFRN